MLCAPNLLLFILFVKFISHQRRHYNSSFIFICFSYMGNVTAGQHPRTSRSTCRFSAASDSSSSSTIKRHDKLNQFLNSIHTVVTTGFICSLYCCTDFLLNTQSVWMFQVYLYVPILGTCLWMDCCSVPEGRC